jgi:pimeloyl-ACP methyl ester carboxylesterase/tetratricopeptide (TPR) repeat protein
VRKLAIVLLAVVLPTLPVQPRETSYAVVDVSVVPMDREGALAHQIVIVEGERIVALGPVGKVSIPHRAVRIDGRNRYLIPGLFDMHAHVDDTTDLMLFLARGITTVRNLEGRPEHLVWRRQLRAHELLGPDMFTAGPFVNLPRIATPADARQAVEEQKAAGYDEIKIHGGLTSASYDTLCAVAQRLGIPVVGHAVRNLPFSRMVGCHSELSHVEEFIYRYFNYDVSDSSIRRIPEAADSARRAGLSVTATLVTYRRILAQVENLDSLMAVTPTRLVRPAELVFWQRDNNRYVRNWGPGGVPTLRARYNFQVALVRALVKAGVPVMTGSDAIGPMWVPGWASQEELRIFVQDVGMTPFQALSAATVVPARFLGEANTVGTIALGMRADLLLLDENPLADISATERIAGVMTRGRWLPREELDRRLEMIAQQNARVSAQAADVLALGWQRAATALCDSASAARLDAIRPIIELGVEQAVANRVRDAGLTQARLEAAPVINACPSARLYSEPKLNTVANELLKAGRSAEAIRVLEANLDLFPRSFLAPYWLAEAQLAAGDTTRAIVNYRKSVANDSAMLDAIERLKSLHAWKTAPVVEADSLRFRRLMGEYRLGGDIVIAISYEFFDDPELTYTNWKTGQYRRLFPRSESTFVAGPGHDIESPVSVTVTFPVRGDGLRWQEAGSAERFAPRIQAYKEEEVRFMSADGVSLTGTLILPLTLGPHPTLVFLHGSGPTVRYSFRSDPYFFASNGIASLVYDKRGTGASGGKFDFSASAEWFARLAEDGMASVSFLTTRSDIDPKRIGLWGISQSGWTLPIVAAQSRDVSFALVVSGPAVTVGQEALFSELTGDDPGGPGKLSPAEIARRMKASVRKGFDPEPYLRRMRVPSLWIYGGRDQSIPADLSMDALKRLKAAGRHDITIRLFPNGNHTLLESETGSRDERPWLTRYVPGYFDTMLTWVKRQVATGSSSIPKRP